MFAYNTCTHSPISVQEVGEEGRTERHSLMNQDLMSADSSTSDDAARNQYAEPCTEPELGPNNTRKLVTGAFPSNC